MLLVAALLAALPPPDMPARVVLVAADAERPRREADLKPDCSQRDDKGLVSFVAGADGRILLAALTDQPLADPRLDLWLSPHFSSSDSGGRATGTQDWAYVHDLDGDGRIDQIAFLIGPLAIRTGAPGEPPVPPIVDGRVQVTGVAAMKAFIARVKFGFWQAADLDGDGVADAAAWPAERRVDGWSRGWAVQGLAAGGCRLVDAAGHDEAACTLAPGGRDLVGEGATAHLWAADAAGVFRRITAAAAACRLAAGRLRRAD